MPLVMVKTSTPVPADSTNVLLSTISKLVSECSGKPETYIMATIEHVDGVMAGEPGALAFVDVRGIGGLTPEVNAAISSKLCALLESELGVPPDKVYVNFTDIDATNWGWKGGTFG